MGTLDEIKKPVVATPDVVRWLLTRRLLIRSLKQHKLQQVHATNVATLRNLLKSCQRVDLITDP